MKFVFYLLLLLISGKCLAQDSTSIKVLFLYGSKPAIHFRDTEKKWFGGVPGGHVGIESEIDKILNFTPNGKFHLFGSRRNRRSKYVVNTNCDFYEIFGGSAESIKKCAIVIPVNKGQKNILDSLNNVYTTETPYDYAFFGMRCAAATADLLGKLHIIKEYSHSGTWMKIFYPKMLRKKLLKMAEENQWPVIREGGTSRRKWEKD